MTIPTPAFREDKAAEAVHFLLKLGGGTLDVYNLVKFMYLANKTALFSHHRAITNDAFASLPFGPVPSDTYNRLQHRSACGKFWKSLIEPRCGNQIRLANPEHEYQTLSGIDRQILFDTYTEYKNLSFDQLKNVTHAFPEWTDPNGSSRTIPVQELYEKNEIPKEGFEAFVEYAEIQRAMQQLGSRG